MTTRNTGIAIAAVLALWIAPACSDTPTRPEPAAAPGSFAALSTTVFEPQSVVISEIHYDNASTDVGEAIEIAGPAGTDLTGWQVVLYNGFNGTVYRTNTLTGALPVTCGATGVVALNYPTNGIQNGSPDGMALVNAAGEVVEFLSYEGTFTATNGPAAGTTSTDIGVSQTASTPAGESLQRTGPAATAWTGAAPETFGACNGGDNGAGGDGGDGTGDDDGGVYEGPISTDPLFLSEMRADQSGADTDEYVEIGGAPGASMDGIFFIVLGDGAGGFGVVEEVVNLSGRTIGGSGTYLIAESSFSLGTADETRTLNLENGGNQTYLLVRGFTGSNGQDLDTNDDGELEHTPWTGVADCLSLIEYLGRSPIYCDARLGRDESFTPGHVLRNASGWISAAFSTAFDTPGIIEFDPTSATAGVIAPWGVGTRGEVARISLSARQVGLPEGYSRAIFVNAFDDYRDRVDVTLSFTSSDASIVTVDEFLNLTARSPGAATVTALAPNGTSATVHVEVVADVPSGVPFQDHTELGTPADADPADDLVIRRDEYTTSFNPARGGPNWVSWNLDQTHFGSESRCECYTPDPELPAWVPQVVNFDYTGSGYNRGHMTMSANRSATLPDNAATYLTSNILPQAGANNGGPWLDFENYVNNRARGGEEVWVVAGGEYSDQPPTLKDAGKVAVPDYTWKVAVFLPRDATLGDIRSRDELEVIAIRTPNRVEAGVRGSVVSELVSRDWEDYVVLVDEIEAATGYDLLDLLPDGIEPLIESGFDRLLDRFVSSVHVGKIRRSAANALNAELDQAAKRLSLGDERQAVRRLETFLQQLGVFAGNGMVAAEAEAALRASAEAVIAILAL